MSSFYLVIKAFFRRYFLVAIPHFDLYFTIAYGVIIAGLAYLSLSGTLNKFILYFKCAIFILSAFYMSALLGIIYVIYQDGLNPQMQMYSTYNDKWFVCYDEQGNEIRQFDPVFVCLIIILASLLAPIVFRPVDFVKNIGRYMLGMIMYICMLPLYTTILPIYSICNSHHISWGNRPGTAQYQ